MKLLLKMLSIYLLCQKNNCKSSNKNTKYLVEETKNANYLNVTSNFRSHVNYYVFYFNICSFLMLELTKNDFLVLIMD